MKIELTNVNYIYNKGYSGETTALKDVCLRIDEGEMIAVVGGTGSGKSTLIQMFNGLLKPLSGEILFNGQDIYSEDDKLKLRELRKKVGLVFQYPESQLFDETVLKDVSFGPKNLGFSEEEAKALAQNALRITGISEDSFDKSPFELSGGNMRRAAIAGVLAMEPEILILDEPTAGLDPKGKTDILDAVEELKKHKDGMTVIFVSHNMEEVAEYSERMIALDKGIIVYDGKTEEAFKDHKKLEGIGLKAPDITYFCDDLGIKGVSKLNDAAEKILSLKKR